MNSVDILLEKPFSLRPLQEKLEIKKLGRPTPELNLIQTINIKSGNRSVNRVFKRDVYEKHNWLCGCNSRNALFCFPCLLYGGESSWAKSGFTDLNHLTVRAKKHEASEIHIKNSLQLALLGSVNVAEQLDSAYRRSISVHNEKVLQNRYILNIIINCVRFCGAFELALRGHDESESSSNPGIFRGLINFSAELDVALKTHLERATVFKGTSKTIQNEILEIMLAVCQEKISEEIKHANFLAVIADETSDVSNTFQMALVFRYVVKDRPVERFWNFLTPSHHDSQTLASCILEELNRLKINEHPYKLIAQTYDGASVMAGSSRGVQAIIKQVYTEAQYIHCYAHQINLIMMKASSINRNVRIFFANVQGFCTYFSNSTQRTTILDEVVKKRLPHSVPTRWNFQSRSITTIHNHLDDLKKCLKTILDSDDIRNDATLSQASGHLKTLASANFTFWLNFFNKIMPLVEILFGQLQNVKLDPTVTKKLLTEFEENILTFRKNIDLTGTESESSASTPAKRMKVEKKEWKREATEVCDVIITQAKERFTFTGHLAAASLFICDNFQTFNSKFPEEIFKIVSKEYPILDSKKLRSEVCTLYSAEEFRKTSGAVSLLAFIKENKLQDTFSECTKLLEILVTIPMTTAEAERCFSTLKRIKTFLRNSMSQDRLSALAMLSIEKDLIMDIPDFNQKVIDKFAQNKERRMDFLFK